jgi:hypothetical protein
MEKHRHQPPTCQFIIPFLLPDIPSS